MFKKTTLLIFIFISLPQILFAQNLDERLLYKLGPKIIAALAAETEVSDSVKSRGLSLYKQSVDQLSGELIYDVIVKTEDHGELEKLGVQPIAVHSKFITTRVTIQEIIALAQSEAVNYIYQGEIFYFTNDVANGLIGADLVKSGFINSTAYDGTDVIVLIIDSGIDWSHKDFRDPVDTTQSRILYIWDQTLTKTGSEKTPADRDGVNFGTLTYGVEYTKTDIEDEIDGTAAGFVREQDIVGHGTHVAGSAAGNGSSLSPARHKGIATGADLVIVKTSLFSTDIINALTYAGIIATTESKPVVVNMSLGGHQNAHDGTSDQEVAIDDFTGTGKVCVVSAGNEGEDIMHITGTVPSSGSATISIVVSSYTPFEDPFNDLFGFDLWWNNDGDVTAQVTSPNSFIYTRTAGTSGSSATNDGTIYISNFIDAGNSDRNNQFTIIDDIASNPPVAGTWSIQVTNNSASAMTYHGWLHGSSIPAALTGGNTDYTVGSPGTAIEAITVGAYASRWRWSNSTGDGVSPGGSDRTDNIGSFSSIGPTRDGRQKPDIAAPGQFIASSTSSNVTPDPAVVLPGSKHHVADGTSMSSPIVAGAVALMLDYNSSLTYSDVKTFINGNADSDSFTGSVPNYTWGNGKINIFRAMVNAISSSSISQEILSNQDWTTGFSQAGNFTASWLAEKFTPTMSGKVTGIFFNLGTGTDLPADISIEIYTNSSGDPGSKLGGSSTVTFDRNEMLDYSWNYANFETGAATVTSSTDYWAVLKIPSGTNFNLGTDGDGSSTTSKYSFDNGSSWDLWPDNFGIRAVISPGESALPVEIVSFTGNVLGNKILLEWETATEVNNYGFDVERKMDGKKKDNWKKIGFAAGYGNSNSPKSYKYKDRPDMSSSRILYRIKQIDTDGEFSYSPEVVINNIIIKDMLSQNFPNPFNPTTKISFNTKEKGYVNLSVYNVLGEKVLNLLNDSMEAGNHEVEFNALEFPSGIYFYKLETANFFDIKKMILLK